ncbi:hypothetical protein [Cellulomonas sp. JZ18]|uniref:hypothetical protein n=1 Tax=Cellulomonas sp. JZ18 TaxID=2654191 RepID=UPI001E38F865|nr:hypothetical protein [Cellulomonas sp. JZ18]
MPIFELDEGRPRLVQPMQPLAGSFAQEVGALVTHHLAAIAGEPLFVVRSRAGAADRGDLPELLALDAAGRPVVVEVAQVLDDDAIVAALRHGGAAGRMTTSDLARAYHADPSRFAVDFAAFREHVPAGAQTSRRDGVRLLLLCSEVAAEAADTLGFLRGRRGRSRCCRSASCAGTSGACSTCRRSRCTRARAARWSRPHCGSCGPARASRPSPTRTSSAAPRPRCARRPPRGSCAR